MQKGLIVGYGNMGETHADRFAKLGQHVLIADPLIHRQEIARERGLVTYSSAAEAISNQHPAFISICTPTNEHAKLIEEVLLYQGGPLFVEKPVVRTIEEANKIRQLAKNYPYPIFIGEVELFNPELRTFLNYEATPARIDISRDVNLDFFLHGAKPWFLNQELSGGIILDLMIHDITLLMYKYGRPTIETVSGFSRKYDCIDDVTAELQFDKFTAQIHGSWISDNTETPIITYIKIEDDKGIKTEITCDSYAIRDKQASNDVFLLEDSAFLKAIQDKKAPFPLELFLGAVEVANEIVKKLNK